MTEDAEVIEGTETPSGQDDSLTPADFAAQRLGETQEEETEEAPETTQDEGQPEAEAEEEPSSDIDLDTMSEDELKELGAKLGSRAVSRFGALTARAKAAEEKLRQLETTQGNPLEAPEPEADNPYANLKTPESLQAKYKEVSEVIEWAEDVLDENEEASLEDEVTEVDGNSLTKAEVKQTLRRARKAKDKHLPSRWQALGAAQQRARLKTQFEAKAKEEFAWIGDKESDLNTKYQQMLADPRIATVEEAVPDLGPQMSYILAHAANSMFAAEGAKTKPVAEAPPVKPKLKPPANPTSSAAPSARPDAARAKHLEDLAKRFDESQSTADFIALRAAKHSTR